MKIARQCVYCATTINLLPALMLTPLYVLSIYDKPVPASEFSDPYNNEHRERGGFRLAFKWFRFHVGIEVHYYDTSPPF